jgi:hypothetical protein
MELNRRVDEFNEQMRKNMPLALPMPSQESMELNRRVNENNEQMRNENNVAFALPMPSQESMELNRRVNEFNNWATNFNDINAFALGQSSQPAPPQTSWTPQDRRLGAPTSNKVIPPITSSFDMNSMFSGLVTTLTIANAGLKLFNIKIRGDKNDLESAQFFKKNIKMDIAPEKVEEMRISSRGVPVPNIQALKNLGIDVNASNNELFKQTIPSSDTDEQSDSELFKQTIPSSDTNVQSDNFVTSKTPTNTELDDIWSTKPLTIIKNTIQPIENKNKIFDIVSLNLSNESYGVETDPSLYKNNLKKHNGLARQQYLTSFLNSGIFGKSGGGDLKETNLLIYLFNLYDLSILEDNFNLFIQKKKIIKNSVSVLNVLYILNIYDYIKKLRDVFIILNDLKSYENLNNYLKRLNDEFDVLFYSFSGGNLIKSNKKKQNTIKKIKTKKHKKTIRKGRNKKNTLKKKFKKLKKTKKNLKI